MLLLLLAMSPAASGAHLIFALDAGSSGFEGPPVLGGFKTDSVNGIALDAQGNIYITGNTYSPVFPNNTPVVGKIGSDPYQGMFIAKLSPDGSRFLYVKTIPNASASAIAVDSAGNAYVAGTLMPFNGPTLPNLPVSLGTGSSQEPSVIVKAGSLRFERNILRVLEWGYIGKRCCPRWRRQCVRGGDCDSELPDKPGGFSGHGRSVSENAEMQARFVRHCIRRETESIRHGAGVLDIS